MIARAVIASALLCLLSQAAWAQAQQPSTPTPERESGAVPEAGQSLILDTAPADIPRESESIKGFTLPRVDLSFDPGRGCTGCPAISAPPVNANAPSLINGTLGYSAEDGSRVTLGLLGARNMRLGAFMFRPIGGQADLAPPPASSLADVSTGRTQWLLSSGVRKMIGRTQTGVDLGIAGDVFIPLNSTESDAAPRRPYLPSGAMRLGGLLGF